MTFFSALENEPAKAAKTKLEWDLKVPFITVYAIALMFAGIACSATERKVAIGFGILAVMATALGIGVHSEARNMQAWRSKIRSRAASIAKGGYKPPL